MGKRKRGSTENSKESTPVASDSDDPSPRSSRRHKAAVMKKQRDKTSAELCEEYKVNNVDLEYTEADYQNLTTFSFFVRMVRPQISAANPRVGASKMTSILETKWREFREAKKVFDLQKKMEKEKLEAEKARQAKEAEEKAKQQAVEEDDSDEDTEIDVDAVEEDSTKADSAEDDAEVDSTKEEESEDNAESPKSDHDSEVDELSASEEEEIKPKASKKRASFGHLRIKMPIPMRKSDRNRKPKHQKSLTDQDFEKLLGSDEDQGAWNSDDDKPRKKRQKKRADSDDDFDSEDDDFEEKPRKRRRVQTKKSSQAVKRKSVKTALASEDDFEGSSQSSDSGSTSDTDDSEGRSKRSRKKRRGKKTVERIHIPGERRSERSKKTPNKTKAEMTDREFEKLMKSEDTEKKEKKKNKQKQERAKRKAWELEHDARKKVEQAGKKGYWQGKPSEDNKEDNKEENDEKNEDEDPGNESDHCWYCGICKDGGDLLLCDTCPMAFHKDCIKMEEVPEGDWSCPKCTGQGLEQFLSDSSDEEEGHQHFCKVCRDGGDVLLCDFCPLVYHQTCLNPPLKQIPEGDWKCPRCVILEKPLKSTVKQILTWRWSHQLKGTDELDHTRSPRKKSTEQKDAEGKQQNGSVPEMTPERQLFVKYVYHSYWDCEWIPELALEVFQIVSYAAFRRKWDLDEPPALEDGSSFGKLRHKTNKGEDDPHNLEDKYYRYGVKPEWLLVHRIIAHEGRGKNLRFLVKWQDLTYEECTWEYPNEIPAGLDGWDKHVDAYWAHRKEKLKDNKDVKKKKAKKSTLKKKLEKQPEYLGTKGGKLHPYQLEGLNWLRFSWAQDTNTILADEMGLGKTIQAIAILYTLWKEGHAPGPFCVSAPLSTITNWEREFGFWAPEMYVVTYIGIRENRAVIRERDFSYNEDPFPFYHKPARFRSGNRPKFDVLLTNYELCNVDQTTLKSIHWSVLVIDEAHRLKNQQSLFFKTMSSYNLDYKLLLTGTPLQNNLEELFNLLAFLEPTKFDDMASFLEQFSEISKDEQVSRLHEMLAPHMLRRLKSDVLKDLPSKAEFIVRVELSPLQKKFYKHILTKNFEALNVRGMSNQTSLMNIMMDLRKCCQHPYLFPAAVQDAPMLPNGAFEGSALSKGSGKLELLSKMLDQLKRDGHRVLIFSQMTRVLDILEDFLDYKKFGFERIDGNITGPKRQESIDRFNSPDSEQFVFLLSTKAGGLGINLASADTVIIHDMDWNPHNDIQAFSRAHRIGQTKKVMIFRFVCRNSVEEKIAEVCKKKMMLTELVIHRGMGSSEKKESLSKQQVNEILKYGAEKLFKDDEEGKVVYDEEAVKNLLDRSKVGVTETDEKNEGDEGMNEYLRSFKVASYNVKEGEAVVEEEEKEEEEPEKPEESNQQYWQRVLGSDFDTFMVEQQRQEEIRIAGLGKGKRQRKKINYAETRAIEEMMHARRQEEMRRQYHKTDDGPPSDYEPSDISSSESDEEEASEEDGVIVKKHVKTKVQKEVFPPLVARVNNQIEVLGFTPRQRRVFLDTVMKFGMPPDDPYRSQWLVRELRCKPEKVFKAYCALFLRHLCEALPDTAERFADGVPREGLSRRHVLTRIGIIALIRRKVQQFELNNGMESMNEFLKKSEMLSQMLTQQSPNTAVTTQAASAQKSPVLPQKAAISATTEASKAQSNSKSDDVKSDDVKGDSKSDDVKGDAKSDAKEDSKSDDVKEDSKSDDVKEDTKSDDVKKDVKDDVSASSGDIELDEKTGDVKVKILEKHDDKGGDDQKDKENSDDKSEIVLDDKTSKIKDEEKGDKDSSDVKDEEKVESPEKASSCKDASKDSGSGDKQKEQEHGDKDEADGEDKPREDAEGAKPAADADDAADADGSSDEEVVSQLDGTNDEDGEVKGDENTAAAEPSQAADADADAEPTAATGDEQMEVDEERDTKDKAAGKEEAKSDDDDDAAMDTDKDPEDSKASAMTSDDSDKEEEVSHKEEAAEDALKVPSSPKQLEKKAKSKEETKEENEQEDKLEKKSSTEKTGESSEEKKSSTEKTEEPSEEKKSSTEKTEEPSEEKKSRTEKTEEPSEEKKSSTEKTEEPSEEKKSSTEKAEESSEEKKSSTEKTEEPSEEKKSSTEKTEEPSEEKKSSTEKAEESSEEKKSSTEKTEEPSEEKKSRTEKAEEKSRTEKAEEPAEEKSSTETADEPMETDESAESKEKSSHSTDKGAKSKPAERETVQKTDNVAAKRSDTPVTPPSGTQKTAKDMRSIFWIADGGFTELHALWTYEERHMTPGREYETWHRRHDFWLLAGIATHGYRHWQEILNDGRFELLNRAFRTEGEVMRKAAFLNRRFQLLEQALVIEEQLRKAAAENEERTAAEDDRPEDSLTDLEGLKKLDSLSEDLRRLNQGEKPCNAIPTQKLHKVWNAVSRLIQDVRQGTFTNMPATMAKPPSQPPKGLPPRQTAPIMKKTPPAVRPGQAPVITID